MVKNDGGGIYTTGNGRLALNGAVIQHCYSDDNGGGVSAFGNVAVTGSTFDAQHGGQLGRRVYVSVGKVTVQNSEFKNNVATSGSGAGVFANGQGAIEVKDGSLFEGNTAGTHGGGVCSWQGTVTIENSVFQNNQAAGVGGAGKAFFNLIVSGSTFTGNYANKGGDLFLDYYLATITDSKFEGNTATTSGGGVNVAA